MKILHVTDCYLPRLGGIEMHVRDLAARQVAAGHDVTVLTRTPDGGSTTPEPIRVERHTPAPLSMGSGGSVRRVALAHDIDLVHAHLSVGSPFAWAALRALRGLPSVATVHSVVPDSPAALRAALALTRFPTRSVAFTAVSEAAAAPWRRAMGDRLPVRLLPNGIDPSDWRCRHDPGSSSTFTVVSVGRFARRKRQRAMVRMLAQLRAQLPPHLELRAVLVGDGAQLGTVRDAVHHAGLSDCVELPGALSRAEIRAVHARADVYVAPATLESFGIAALEARCAGVPVVGMAQGGVREFITDGVDGFLVQDDAGMLDAVRRLALDPELRDRIRLHNESTEPTMAWPLVLAQHDQVYLRAQERAANALGTRALGSVLTTR